MSYILDALKKAERERGLRQIPTIMTVHTPGNVHRNRLWFLIGALVLCAGAAIWLALPSLRTTARPVSPQSAGQYNQVTNLPDGKQAAAPASASPPSASPAPSQRPGSQTAEPGSEKSVQPKITPRTENARRLSQPVQPAVIFPPLLGEDEEADFPPAELIHTQRQPKPGGINPPNAADRLKSDAVQEKPVTLTEALGKMKLSLLYYSDERSERTVFINGRKYREGDYVDGTYLLESITLDGATLSYQGERAILRPLPK